MTRAGTGAGPVLGTAATSLVDDGTAAGVADTGTWATGTRWAVKNLFELKLGQRVRVHGNLMEHAWQESQTGFAVLLTPRNQDATSPWIAVRDVTFTGNLVRHAGSGVQIEGYDTNATSGQTRRITIAQNIFDDISASAWGGSGRWIQIGNGPSDLTIDHNTVLHDGQAIYVYGGSYGAEMTVANLRFTNNLLKHNTYGIMGNARAYGTDTLTAYFPGALVQRNTFAGGSAARYPAGNEFPTVAFWQGQFVDVTASNFALIASSSYRASGTDGLDLGAPVAQVEADALTARQGRPGAPPPVVISTTTLPAGQTGAAYAATLQATGGSGTYGWRVTAGALPAGLSLAAATGVLRGTPGQSGTFPITVQAQDAADPANVAGQAYALRIASTPPAVSLASPIPGATLVGPTAALVAAATDADGTVTRVDFYANATILGSASAAPWSITWDPVAPGTYRLTAVATDNDGLTTTSAAADVTVVAPVTTDPIAPAGPVSTPPIVTPSLPPGIPLPGTIQAEDFDDGGEGVGYRDTTGDNKGGVYRATNVDIEPTRDRGRGSRCLVDDRRRVAEVHGHGGEGRHLRADGPGGVPRQRGHLPHRVRGGKQNGAASCSEHRRPAEVGDLTQVRDACRRHAGHAAGLRLERPHRHRRQCELHRGRTGAPGCRALRKRSDRARLVDPRGRRHGRRRQQGRDAGSRVVQTQSAVEVAVRLCPGCIQRAGGHALCDLAAVACHRQSQGQRVRLGAVLRRTVERLTDLFDTIRLRAAGQPGALQRLWRVELGLAEGCVLAAAADDRHVREGRTPHDPRADPRGWRTDRSDCAESVALFDVAAGRCEG